MRKIILVRHGESESNVNKEILMTVPNHKVPLTDLGRRQASDLGRSLVEWGIVNAHFIVSTHLRTRQTASLIQEHVCTRSIKFSPLIREIDVGNFISDIASINRERKIIGNYHYRFPNGESGADLVMRVQHFLDSDPFNPRKLASCSDLYPIIVETHAMTMRAFQTIWDELSPDEFDALPKPKNCEILEHEVPLIS